MDKKIIFNILAVIFGTLLIAQAASAEILIGDVSISPHELWIDESDLIYISFKCTGCDRADLHIVSDETEIRPEAHLKIGTTDTYQYEYSPTHSGKYTVTIAGYNTTGNETNETTTGFSVYRLKGEILEPNALHPYLVYRGEKIGGEGADTPSITFDFYKIEDDEQEITVDDSANVDFELYLGDIKIDLNDGKSYGRINYNRKTKHWELSFKLPEETAPGIYDVKVVAKYIKGGVHTIDVANADSMIVKPSLEAKIVSPTTSRFISLHGTDKINVKVRVSYKGNPIVLNEPSFRLYVGNEEMQILVTQDTEDNFVWNLQTIVPGKEAGTRDLTVYVEYEGETPYPTSLSEKDAIHFVIPFKGRITDSTGTIRHVKIKLENNDSSNYYVIENGNDGRYSANIIPGRYEMDVEFPEIMAHFRKVEITEDNLRETSVAGGPINYDSPKNVKVIENGINVVKLVVLEFDLPFHVAELTIPYSDAEIKNEEDLEVYLCENWNFGKVACADRWKRIDNFIINSRGNIVLLNATDASAFVIGERKRLQLTLDGNLGYGNYIAGDKLIIKGQVTDEKGNAIEAADVEVGIVGIDETKKTAKTIISGNFKSQLELPEAKGLYNVSVSANKNPYKGITKYFTIETEIKKELSFFNVPDGEKIYVGDPFDIKFTITNTGQTKLSDIRLSVAGLASEWYQLLPISVNTLEPSDSEDIELKILVPEKYCEKYECKNYYPVTITAKAGDVVKDAMMTITLRREKEDASTSKTEQETNTKASAERSGLEGFFALGTGSSFENAVMFIGIVIIVVLIGLTIKKKQIKPSHGKEVNLLHYMKNGMKSKNAGGDSAQLPRGGLLGQVRKNKHHQ